MDEFNFEYFKELYKNYGVKLTDGKDGFVINGTPITGEELFSVINFYVEENKIDGNSK